jgi:predicted negative regulator of RcsB-dependent stress response
MTESASPQPGKTRSSDIPAVLRLPVQYWKQSVAVAVVVLVAAGGYALFGVYQKSQVEKAENELGTITITKTGAERLAALETLAKSAPAGARDGIYLEMAKTAQALGDFAKAATAWETVSQHAPAGMKTVAGLGYASALSQSGQNDKAVAVLEGLLASAPKPFTMTVDRQLAATAEAAGAWSKALAAYERMKAEGNVQNAGFIDARIADLKAKAAGQAKTNG